MISEDARFTTCFVKGFLPLSCFKRARYVHTQAENISGDELDAFTLIARLISLYSAIICIMLCCNVILHRINVLLVSLFKIFYKFFVLTVLMTSKIAWFILRKIFLHLRSTLLVLSLSFYYYSSSSIVVAEI